MVPHQTPMEKEANPLKYGYGVRHTQLIIFFLCLTVNVMVRAHMGVTIVAMTAEPGFNRNVTNTTKENTHALIDIIPINNTTENVNENFKILKDVDDVVYINIEQNYKIWNWPKSVQEILLNAFFIGYTIMLVPMGLLCHRYGGKLRLQIGLFINGLISVITPPLTVWGGWKALCCCRVLQGLTQAGTYPAIQSVLGKWVPVNERATLACCVHTGFTVGFIVASQLAGLLGASIWGWPSNFYAIGVICLLCFILITIYGTSNPSEHKSITNKERNYIMGSDNDCNGKNLKTPWRAMLTSKPLWGTIIAHIGSNFLSTFFFNQMPSYLHHILGIDVRNSGLLSSLPYVAGFFTILLFGWLSDYTINNKIISKNNARRISTTIAHCSMAFGLIVTSYTSNIVIVVICLVLGISFNMGINSGWMINYIDLAPNFSSTLTAAGSTLANVFALSTPGIVSYVITDMKNIVQWRLMFFITSGVALTANVIFIVLVSTEAQHWNYGDNNETCEEVKNGEAKEIESKVSKL